MGMESTSGLAVTASKTQPLAVGIFDAAGNSPSLIPNLAGFQLSVTPLPSLLFADNFDGTVIDTVNRWLAPVLAGAGTMTIVASNLTATTSTTASNGAAITSIEPFTPTIASLTAGALLQMEAVPGVNTNRCFGFYTRPASFTAATPVQDGYVWEIDITGTFGASIYSGGVRIFRQVFPPQAFAPISIGYQGLSASFFINSFALPALTVQVLQPSLLNLPLGFHCINHTSGPVGAPTWSITGTAVVDASGTYNTLFNGQAQSRARSPGKFVSVNALSIAAEATVWTPAAGRRFRLMGYQLSSTGAQNIVLKDSTAGSTIMVIPGVTAGQLNFSPPMGNGILSAAAGNVLTANAGGVNALSGFFFGTEE